VLVGRNLALRDLRGGKAQNRSVSGEARRDTGKIKRRRTKSFQRYSDSLRMSAGDSYLCTEVVDLELEGSDLTASVTVDSVLASLCSGWITVDSL